MTHALETITTSIINPIRLDANTRVYLRGHGYLVEYTSHGKQRHYRITQHFLDRFGERYLDKPSPPEGEYRLDYDLGVLATYLHIFGNPPLFRASKQHLNMLQGYERVPVIKQGWKFMVALPQNEGDDTLALITCYPSSE